LQFSTTVHRDRSARKDIFMNDLFGTTPNDYSASMLSPNKNTMLALESSSDPTLMGSGLTTNIASKEIQDQVLQLYAVFFGRGADRSSLDYWSNLITSGYTLPEVSRDFAMSPEWTSQYSDLTPSQQIEHFYQNAFNRSADESGQIHWQSVMNSGVPFYEVARMIVNTAFAGGADIDMQDNATIHAKVDAFSNFSEFLATDTSVVQTVGKTTGANTGSGSSANSDGTPNPEPVLPGALTDSSGPGAGSGAGAGSGGGSSSSGGSGSDGSAGSDGGSDSDGGSASDGGSDSDGSSGSDGGSDSDDDSSCSGGSGGCSNICANAETVFDHGLVPADQGLEAARQDQVAADQTIQQEGVISLNDLIEQPREPSGSDPNQIDLASVTQPSGHSNSVLDGDTYQQTTCSKNSLGGTSGCASRADVTAYAAVDTVTLSAEHTLA
jgi:hypothetical protein